LIALDLAPDNYQFRVCQFDSPEIIVSGGDRMKLINKTQWQTRDLRAIISRVAKDELEPAKRKHVTFTVVYGHRGGSSGYATIGGYNAKIRIAAEDPDLIDFAYTTGHECGHLRGLRHGADMHCARYSRKHGDHRAFYSWAAELPLRKKAPITKKRVVDKYAKTIYALARWQTKLKRAKTAIRKLERRKAYYTRRLPVAATGSPSQ